VRHLEFNTQARHSAAMVETAKTVDARARTVVVTLIAIYASPRCHAALVTMPLFGFILFHHGQLLITFE